MDKIFKAATLNGPKWPELSIDNCYSQAIYLQDLFIKCNLTDSLIKKRYS